jgi:lipoprotein signal peptidase
MQPMAPAHAVPKQVTPTAARTFRRQALAIGAVVVAVAAADQVAKWWAWHFLTTACINSGGGVLTGSVAGAWYQSPLVGAVLDTADAMLLLGAGLLIARRHRPRLVLASAALLIAGWCSNLFDRLGLHHWTAPGSVRGVVDFVPLAGRYWNVADATIILGSALLAVALVAAAVRRPHRPRHRRRVHVYRPFASRRVRIASLAGLVVAASLAVAGVLTYSGVSAPISFVAAPSPPPPPPPELYGMP